MSEEPPRAAPTDARTLRKRAAAAYFIGCLLSVVWALSAEWVLRNALGAEIQLGSTAEESVYVSLRNGANQHWTNVRISADGRYVYRVGSLAPNAQVDARLGDFESVYRLPRARGLFYWERVGVEPEESFASDAYTPERIVVEAAQGRVEFPVSLVKR